MEVRIDAMVDFVRFLGSIDAHGLARLQDLPDDAAVVGYPELAPFDSQGGPADQDMVRPIQRKMLARSALSKRVAASAICTKSGSISASGSTGW